MQNGTKNWLIALIVVIVIVAIIFIVWASYNAPASAPTTSTSVTTPASSGPLTVNVASDPTLGSYLSGPNGMTLYTFASDTPNMSNCNGACAQIWLPYTTATSTVLNGGPNVTGVLGNLLRSDGSLQVSYNGAPLYYYSKDVNPGDVTGEGVGGVWFVAKP